MDQPAQVLERLSSLSGIRKAIFEICKINLHGVTEFDCDSSFNDIIQFISDKSTIGISYYCFNSLDAKTVQERLTDYILNRIKVKTKKTKLLKIDKNEVFIHHIQKRRIWDFVCYQENEDYHFGLTFFIPDLDQSDRSKERPLFLPEITMSPMLARLLINLAGVKQGGFLLDPFCGSGTILYEALKRGINCLGLDKDPKRVKITTRNLNLIQKNLPRSRIGHFEVKVGNALNLERYFKKDSIDAIVTEPILLPTLRRKPRKEQAEAMIAKSKSIYLKTLERMSKLLTDKGRIVIVTPSIDTKEGHNIRINLLPCEPLGLRIFQPSSKYQFKYPIRVEGQATKWIKRELYVFQR
ncbi:MAG: DNA methyltransferase [Conexivisphaerales archaeon]